MESRFLTNKIYSLFQNNGLRLSRAVMLFSLIILCMMTLASCAHQSERTLSSKAGLSSSLDTPNILIVNTNSRIDRYAIAEASFTESISDTKSNTDIRVLDLGTELHPLEILQDTLNEHDYDAIYAIGAKALGSVDYIDPDMPVIFSSVLNWRRFHGQDNYYGIASEVAPKAQLTWFKYFFPEVKKVGVLHSVDNLQLIQDARISANELSLTLIASDVKAEDSLEKKANTLLDQIDVLWLVSDPVVLATTGKAELLFELAHKKGIPVLSYNRFFDDLGALLSITADLPTTGRQAALMMKNVLAQHANKESVQFPAGSRISLNAAKAKAYGIVLNEDALDSVDELVGE